MSSNQKSPSRKIRIQKILKAELMGYIRGYPYKDIGLNIPRWYFNGSYYSYKQLPNS